MNQQIGQITSEVITGLLPLAEAVLGVCRGCRGTGPRAFCSFQGPRTFISKNIFVRNLPLISDTQLHSLLKIIPERGTRKETETKNTIPNSPLEYRQAYRDTDTLQNDET